MKTSTISRPAWPPSRRRPPWRMGWRRARMASSCRSPRSRSKSTEHSYNRDTDVRRGAGYRDGQPGEGGSGPVACPWGPRKVDP